MGKIRRTEMICIGFIMLAVSALTILDIRGGLRSLGLLLALLCFLYTSHKSEAMVLFFLIPFTSDIDYFIFGFPYISILQMILIFKSFISAKSRFRLKFAIPLLLLTVVQLYASLISAADIRNVIIFVINMALLVVVMNITAEMKEKAYRNYMGSFTAGMIVASAAGAIRTDLFGAYPRWQRYQGLWTDPNFMALLCLIALSFLLYIGISNLKIMPWLIPGMAVLLYTGYRTYSRTFIFAMAVIAVVFSAYYFKLLKNKSKNQLIVSIFIFGCLVVAFIAIFDKYILDIISRRGVVFSGADWSHGRFTYQGIILEEYVKSDVNILFGLGIFNSGHFFIQSIGTQLVSHNTYVDLIAEIGLIGLVLLMGFFFAAFRHHHFLVRSVFSFKGIFLLLLLFYGVSLSLLSSDFLYMFIGLFPVLAEKRIGEEVRIPAGMITGS